MIWVTNGHIFVKEFQQFNFNIKIIYRRCCVVRSWGGPFSNNLAIICYQALKSFKIAQVLQPCPEEKYIFDLVNIQCFVYCDTCHNWNMCQYLGWGFLSCFCWPTDNTPIKKTTSRHSENNPDIWQVWGLMLLKQKVKRTNSYSLLLLESARLPLSELSFV